MASRKGQKFPIAKIGNFDITADTDGSLSCSCSTFERRQSCIHIKTVLTQNPGRTVEYIQNQFEHLGVYRLPLFGAWLDRDARHAVPLTTSRKDNIWTLRAKLGHLPEDYSSEIDIWIDEHPSLKEMRLAAINWAGSLILACMAEPGLEFFKCNDPGHIRWLANTVPNDDEYHLKQEVQRDVWTMMEKGTCWTCNHKNELLIPF